MKKLLSIFIQHDWIITSLALSLLAIGSITIYGATFNSESIDQGQGIIYKQLILILVSLIGYFAIISIDYRWLKESNILWVIYFVTLALLAYVKFFTPEISGTHRWILLGNFSLQPAEYAKITIILISAFLLSGGNSSGGKYKVEVRNEYHPLLEKQRM